MPSRMYRRGMDPVDEVATALLDAGRALVAIAVRTVSAGPVPLTVVQHRVLVLVADRGSLSVTAVASALGVNQSTASRHCARLEQLGLVARARAAHDGRSVDVALTAAGRRQVQAVRSAREREITEVLSRMPRPVSRAALQALEQFSEAAGEPDVSTLTL
jgi:DNA-binding MarR family transcriptional regulator